MIEAAGEKGSPRGGILRGMKLTGPRPAGWFWLVLAAALGGSPAPAAEAPEQFRTWGDRARAHAYLRAPAPPAAGAAGAGERDAIAALARPDDAARGFACFARHPFAVSAPADLPRPDERIEHLVGQECAGEYGALTFCVFAGAGGTFSVAAGDLAGPGGRRIASDRFDVRTVRYVDLPAAEKGAARAVTPLLLERAAPVAVAPRSAQQFWVAYHVPAGTPAGDYEGHLRISVDGAVRHALPLRLKVLPFALAPSPIDHYIYTNNGTAAGDIEPARRAWIDQRCHGMTATTFVPPVTRDGELQVPLLEKFLDAYAAAGLKKVHVGLWNRITAEWLNTPDKSIRMYGPWFRYYPFSKKLDDRYVAAVRAIDDACRRRGIKLVFAVADEAGSHPWTTEATQHYNDLLKRELPGVTRELTVGGGWAMKRPEDELWKGRVHIWTTNRWLPDKLDLVRRDDPGAVFQLYNMAGAGSAPGGVESARALYGFFAHKAGVAGTAQWTYYHSGTPEHNYSWPADDPKQGHVPTLRWEAVREGVKDMRYLATLEAAIKGRTDSPAEAARALVRRIHEKIILRTDQYDPIGGGRVPVPGAGQFDRWRQEIAEVIGSLK